MAGGSQGGKTEVGEKGLKEHDVSLASVIVFQHVQSKPEGMAQEDITRVHEDQENDDVQQGNGIPGEGGTLDHDIP